MAKTCGMPDCDKPLIARGMCGMHYQRWNKFGDPDFRLPPAGNPHADYVAPTRRTCATCGFEGPVAQFKRDANRCRPCQNAYQREWKRLNPDKVKADKIRNAPQRERRELRRRARICGNQDFAFIEGYHATHDGKCEICGVTPAPGKRRLAIDHDHDSGVFRGLLCDNCNNGLGRFKDSTANLLAAIAYLERARSVPQDLYELLQPVTV